MMAYRLRVRFVVSILIVSIVFPISTIFGARAQSPNNANLYNAGGFGSSQPKQHNLSGQILKQFSDNDNEDMPPTSNKPKGLREPLFGKESLDFRRSKIHQTLKLTDTEVIEEPNPDDFSKPARRRDEIDRRVIDSNLLGQYDYNRYDLSVRPHGDGHTYISRHDYAKDTGNWVPSPIDLFSNGGFGLRSPNGIIDLPPQNGRVEKTFSK